MVSTEPLAPEDSDDDDDTGPFDIHAPEVVRAQYPPTEVGEKVQTLLPIPRFHKSKLVPAGAVGEVKAIAPVRGFVTRQHQLEPISVVWASIDFGEKYGRACAPAMYLERIFV